MIKYHFLVRVIQVFLLSLYLCSVRLPSEVYTYVHFELNILKLLLDCELSACALLELLNLQLELVPHSFQITWFDSL